MFILFGPAHLGALAATALAALAMARAARLPVFVARPRRLAVPLAAVLLANEFIWHLYQLDSGSWEAASSLPLHLCDAALFMAVWAVLTERQIPFELAYFWGLGGSLQALLTPSVAQPFPAYEFLRFFISHGGIVLAVAYLTLGRRMRPGPRSVPRSILITLACMAAVAGLDQALSANYMFLCEKPESASLLDFLGPWPWYLMPMSGIGAVTLAALYLPYHIIDRRRKRPGESAARASRP
ncbi:MAG: TIGR02206 family membrane protein [Planctomycetota bacterium]